MADKAAESTKPLSDYTINGLRLMFDTKNGFVVILVESRFGFVNLTKDMAHELAIDLLRIAQ